jgi:hypothetical protein
MPGDHFLFIFDIERIEMLGLSFTLAPASVTMTLRPLPSRFLAVSSPTPLKPPEPQSMALSERFVALDQ